MRKLLFALCFFPFAIQAMEFKTLESDGIWQLYYSSSNDSNTTGNNYSTHSIPGDVFSFAIEAEGGDALFRVIHQTQPLAGVAFHHSSATLVRAGTTKSFDVRGKVSKPWIVIRDLTGSATAHVTADYLANPGAFTSSNTVTRGEAP